MSTKIQPDRQPAKQASLVAGFLPIGPAAILAALVCKGKAVERKAAPKAA